MHLTQHPSGDFPNRYAEGRKQLKQEINISITGLGVVLYSPFAVDQIKDGEDYLTSNFWHPEKVAEHVNACQLSAFCTGSPGKFRLNLTDGIYPENDINNAMAKIRLGIEVRDQTLCFRDLYDLMEWTPACPSEQVISMPNGFYLLTVFTQLPDSGILGDNQTITIHFQPVQSRPALAWNGVPDLSGD